MVSSSEEDFESLTIDRTRVIDVGDSGTGFDSVGATDPSVLVDKGISFGTDGRYRMWYEGRSGTMGNISTIITC